MPEDTLPVVLASILTGLKVLAIIMEHWPDIRRKAVDPIDTARLSMALSIVMGFAIFVLGTVLQSKTLYASLPDGNPFATADADIVGDGVRAATWTQVVILTLMSIAGSFCTDYSAIQEVGGGLLVTHVALAIALVAPMVSQTLSPINSILGTMMLDAQNSALSVQLVAKQTLASRWQTVTAILCQSAGLIVIGVLTKNFVNNGFSAGEAGCMPAFWWGWVTNCTDGHPSDQRAIWIYYSVRASSVVHCWIYALRNTRQFDQAKRQQKFFPCAKCKWCREEAALADTGRKSGQRNSHRCECVVCETCKGCSRCNVTHCNDQACQSNMCTSCKKWHKRDRCKDCPGIAEFVEGKGLVRGYKYSQIGMSTSLLYIESTLFSVFSLLASERLMTAYQINPTSPLEAFGQVMAIVIAAATAIRAFWVFFSQFWKEDRLSEVLVWDQ
ncbi:hypothetical protein BKA63DRAFT_153028 [Paraphoma chrysanthemicola]|nr:hypothetical protein BKA63DRAFT_153028 [Paraphoma chrysanthemicola]